MNRAGNEAVADLSGKTIVLGVTGGIAAYKAISLVSLLAKSGADVHVALTKSAGQFVTPLPFVSLSKNEVITDLFDEPNPREIAHIALADRADLVVIAPTTANFLAKAATGLADDFLSTMLLATHAPVLVAPAMNVNMWNHPTVRSNVARLQQFGYHVMTPAAGNLACGWVGEGRLPEPDEIHAQIVKLLYPVRQDLNGQRIVVTAGATREHLDPVRVLTNPSSGRMGYALAQAAAARGAEVTLITGPTQLQLPSSCRIIRVTSAAQMEQAVLQELPNLQILLMAAAVSDFRPANYIPNKVKKTEGPLQIEFVRNPDILLSVAEQRKAQQFIVGFAAETEHVEEYAKGKLVGKKLDLIVANDVSQVGAGFESDTNQVLLISPNEQVQQLPMLSKMDTANAILDKVHQLFSERTVNE
ncbi:MAG: bifunctional 4-phosphopantothenoylcysteine decarboxylase/phosphopantothenoylcysteine synthetase [Bacilli bacterium]|nr:bifunctional 4-phosphopantothenoylcysteine decarboxylase/phosphopantothenoylcysteine synthetase [Bacilli bacterium]